MARRRVEAIPELIESLYGSLQDGGGLRPFLLDLSERVGASSALAISVPRHGAPPLPEFVGGDPWIIETYARDYAAIDPLLPRALARVGRADADHHLISRREYERSQIFNDFLLKAERPFLLGAMYASDSSGISGVSLQRSLEMGPFDETNRELLQTLVPHLRRRRSLERDIGSADWKNILLGRALDQLPYAVVVVGRGDVVLAANDLAVPLLGAVEGVRLGHRLMTDHGAAGKALRDAISRCRARGVPETISVPVPSGELRCNVSPVAKTAIYAPDRPTPAVLLCAFPRWPPAAPCLRAMLGLFALTLQEGRLLQALAEGMTLSEAGTRMGLSVSTVRSYAKGVMRKLDVRSQADLVRLVLSAPVGAWTIRTRRGESRPSQRPSAGSGRSDRS